MKVLAIMNAHALAHVSRLLEIAKELRQRGHEILFAGRGKYLQVPRWDGFSTRDLPYIPIEQIVLAVRSQRLWEIYRESQIDAFIRGELDLFNDYQPDLVLIDNRPTARTSSELAGVKTAAVVNVHMSNVRQIPFFSLRNLLHREHVLGIKLADRIENTAECLVYDQLVMRGLNRYRHKARLKRLYSYEHETGDITFLADIPQFSPVRKLQNNMHFIGPLTWHNNLPAPSCLGKLQVERPVVYLSLGSESLDDLLKQLPAIASSGIQIVVAVGAIDFPSDLSLPEGVFLERYINTNTLLPYCDLVCCHGGNGTIYQALSFGLPIVVVASHQEQYYGGKRIEALGLGKALTLASIKHGGVHQTLLPVLNEVLVTGGYRSRSKNFSQHLLQWQGAKYAANLLEKFMA